MTDEPQPQTPLQPTPPPPSRRQASSGNMIAGVLLILFALLLIFTGGGCTVVLLALFFEEPNQGGIGELVPFLLLSLGVFAGGGVAMWFGVRLCSGKYG
jgi:hypothetical protein